MPRILGIGGVRDPSARPAFWLMFTGVIARNVGQPLGFYPIGRLLSLVSAGLEVASEELETIAEPDGDATFLWVLAQRSE